jgi:YD repeat-containing protein
MPPYSNFPCSPGTLNCGGANPAQFNNLKDYQVKELDRSPGSNATPNTFGECGGSQQWCTVPSFSGSIGHRVVTQSGAIEFDIPYDFPNAYCQNWANPDPAEWPTPFHNTTVRIFIGGSELIRSPTIFERGHWKVTIQGTGCNQTTVYSIQLWSCLTVISQNYSIPVTPADCAIAQEAPMCSPSMSTSLGPGNVTLGLSVGGAGSEGTPAFSEQAVPGPLGFSLNYDGNNPADGGPGPSWSYEYGQSLKSVPYSPGKLAWTDSIGFQRTFTGSDAGGYSASNPGDARGNVSLVSGEYVLTTPDGVTRTFTTGSNGYWKKTIDRWGNGALGNTSSSSRATTVQELFGGSTTGRQISLTYDVSGKLKTATDVNSGLTQFGYDTSGRLISICRPGEICASAPWRRYTYDGSSSRIISVSDATNAIRRQYEYNSTRGVQRTWIGAATYAAGKERTQYSASGGVVTVKREKGDGTTVDTSYALSAVTGLWRVASISGACPECGDENSSRTFDATTGRVLTRTNGNGKMTTFSYDADGNVLQMVEDSTGLMRTTSYTYAVPGQYPSVWPSNTKDFWRTKTEPSGAKPGSFVVSTRSWSGTGNLVLSDMVTGFLSSSGSAVSRTTQTTHDAFGRPVSVDGPRPVSDITTYAYYPGTDPLPNKNLLLRVTGADGVKSKFEYHALGGITRLTREITSGSNVDAITEYTYDPVGRRTMETVKATPATPEVDFVTTSGYDAAGRITSTNVKEGLTSLTNTSLAHESGTDRLLTRTRLDNRFSASSGERVSYAYDDRGNVTQETYGYFNGTGSTTEYNVFRVYDGLCRVKKQTFPRDAPTTDDATSRYAYDCAGNLTGIVDANHFQSDATPPNLAYGYDGLNRLMTVTRTASPSNDLTTYGYDLRDQLISVGDPNGASTTYVVDDFGALRQQFTPLAGGGVIDETDYVYDEANNLTSVTQVGIRSSARTYDVANRLASVSGSGLATVTNTYDTVCLPDPVTSKTFGQGRLCRTSDGTITTDYGYDRRGLVTKERTTLATKVYDVAYQYDAAGRRKLVTYPSLDSVMTSFDVNNRPVDLIYTPSGGMFSKLVSGIAHQVNGPIRSFRTAGNLQEARTFDTRFQRLTQRTFSLATNPMTLVMGWQYGDGRLSETAHDKEGNLKALNDVTPGISPPSNRVFGYDPDRYFLTTSTGPYGSGFASQTLSWLYDKNGNRTTETRAGSPTTYIYENDGSGHSNGVIASLSPGGTVNHLNSGDLNTDEQGISYTYDTLGRLTHAQSVSGCSPMAKNVLKRDAVGHRVIREVYPCNSATLSKTEYFVYGNDGNLNYREAYNASGGLTEREAYVYVEGEPVAILRTFGSPTGNFFLHNDHLGRPLAMSSVAGSIVWKREFEPFGKSLAARVSTAFEPGLRFPGQWEYSDSGSLTGGVDILSKINALEDNWNRTYAFRWGRYTQPDPLAQTLPVWQDTRFSGSLFGYASLNPLVFIDRNGLQTSAGTCCECPEGVWSYRGVSSGGSFLVGYVDFHGTYACASKPSLEVKVDGHCWSGGLQAGFGVSFDFSPAGLLLPGAKGCNVSDLFKTSTSLFASGKLVVGVTATGDPLSSTGSVGVGFGAGAGFGAQKCWTRPYKPIVPVPGQ